MLFFFSKIRGGGRFLSPSGAHATHDIISEEYLPRDHEC
jgi:hypothetical protein